MVYDVYPSKKTTIADKFASYLYEDDFETVAYQDGHYRKSPYSCYYDGSNFVIKLDKPIGSYIGDEKMQKRTFGIRIHKPSGIEFGPITVNGEAVRAATLDVNPDIEMPFNFAGSSRTNQIKEFEIEMTAATEYEIKIQII